MKVGKGSSGVQGVTEKGKGRAQPGESRGGMQGVACKQASTKPLSGPPREKYKHKLGGGGWSMAENG